MIIKKCFFHFYVLIQVCSLTIKNPCLKFETLVDIHMEGTVSHIFFYIWLSFNFMLKNGKIRVNLTMDEGRRIRFYYFFVHNCLSLIKQQLKHISKI